MNIPSDLKYTKTHEWAKVEGKVVRVGITDHAQYEISDIVHLELPDVGREFKKGESCAVIESVKAAFDIYAPVSGKITKINEPALEAPEKINADAFGAGWLFEIAASNLDNEIKDLLNAEMYESFLKENK